MRFHGFDDKWQFTAVIVMDALGQLVSPTQFIWAGVEHESHSVSGENGKTRKVPKNDDDGNPIPGKGACPADTEDSTPWVKHFQSESHWTTLSTLMAFVTMLALQVEKRCEDLGLDFAAQRWVLIMDCYPVHIRAEFLKWYKSKYPFLIVLFISANFTGCRRRLRNI